MPPFLRSAFVCILLALSTTIVLVPTSAGSDEIDFSLTDHDGKTFHLQDLRGKVVLVFFGYTLCPDVCPIELQHMATALQLLGRDSSAARGLFITVDPEHDTPEVLARYLGYFDTALLGLTGTKRQIEEVAKLFGVVYQKNSSSSSQYTVDHTANLFIIDKNGKLSAIVPFGFPAAHIENLLREMIAAGG